MGACSPYAGWAAVRERFPAPAGPCARGRTICAPRESVHSRHAAYTPVPSPESCSAGPARTADGRRTQPAAVRQLIFAWTSRPRGIASRARTHGRSLTGACRLEMPRELMISRNLAVIELAAITPGSTPWTPAAARGCGTAPSASLPVACWPLLRDGPHAADSVCGVLRHRVTPGRNPAPLAQLPPRRVTSWPDPLLDPALADDLVAAGLSHHHGGIAATGCHPDPFAPEHPAVSWLKVRLVHDEISPPARRRSAAAPSSKRRPMSGARAVGAAAAHGNTPGSATITAPMPQSVVSRRAGLTVQCRDGIFHCPACTARGHGPTSTSPDA